ncbi:adenine DNA glycosylase-like isoform X1 [Haliotis rubra]|uniref:adenine DNA glycosylase-like isoform X1 n=2 Tax=Haliotis rubra TaxID=36100 RepID=UPI001EE5BFB4|nr:adenine DNA glycosylase-like isoform X1 [Haliotis rubra]
MTRNRSHSGKKTVKKGKENSSKVKGETDEMKIPPVHDFKVEEISAVRENLLAWYDANKRDLPWRKMATRSDLNQRAYAVWVSEVMLQQTQVATVIDYYNKWMKKWPTLQDLAKATLEEVNEMWSGLGYYSRGRRLHEGAQKVVDDLDGEMPKTAATLLKELPGVGRYTAGAIASIAYNEVTGLVDGNVIRVLARLRQIGADSTSQHTMDTFWSHANKLVDPDRPGDYNQSVMELGATVCTPKSPDCSSCPLREQCKALCQVERERQLLASKLVEKVVKKAETVTLLDIECCADDCKLCVDKEEPWDSSLGVMNYPRKGKKKPPRQDHTSVCVLCKKCSDGKHRFLIVQRPKKGLLAGLWEFPSEAMEKDKKAPDMLDIIDSKYNTSIEVVHERHSVGEVVHIFSHIHQTYSVEAVTVMEEKVEAEMVSDEKRWVTKEEFLEAAVSTAMKKIFKAYEKSLDDSIKVNKRKRQSSSDDSSNKKKQMSLNSFFKPKN